MIIGLAGKKGTGKSEIAKYLSNKLNIPVYSFASFLKKLVFDISGLTDDDKENNNYYDGRNFNLIPLKKELKRCGYDKLSSEEIDSLKAIEYYRTAEIYRNLLQYIGTNIFRSRNEYHWINSFKNKYALDESYIVDDIRFFNEYNFINIQNNSKCVKIERPDKKNIDYHVSENEIDRVRFKYKFSNKTNNLLSLYNDIDKYFGI